MIFSEADIKSRNTVVTVPREVQQYYDPRVPQLISHDGKFYRHGPDKPFEFDEAITNKIANAK